MSDTPEKPALDRTVVAHMATLARLRLEPDELARAADDLGRILGHFQAIQAVDTDGVAPLTHVLATHGTPGLDVVQPFPDARAALTALTAHAREGFFVVPRVLEDEALPDVDETDGAPHDEASPDDAP